ncbi:putative C-mannosyltransferase DPY19L1 [Turdus rufiventris]|nr:putative C-mannosyltransferase DPY19L1 [Turdus rufiventris]
MRRGGGGRRGARGDSRGHYREGLAADGERDVLGRGPLSLLRVCGDRLRVFVVDRKAFITKADSKIWLTFLLETDNLVTCSLNKSTFTNSQTIFCISMQALLCVLPMSKQLDLVHVFTEAATVSRCQNEGLYYSYFKIIIEAPSFWTGVCAIMNDKLTEYPLVINTLQRFNLYPEVVLASWYRMYTTIMDFLGVPTKTCWTVNRGKGLSPVESCEGLGDPASFYVAVIFLLNGFMMSLFFIYGTYLRIPSINTGSLIALCVSNIFFMLPWQFAQFVLLTQIASLFAVCIMGYIDSSKLQKILSAHMVSLLVCFILMFGNSMLLTSYYAASLVVTSGILEWSPKVLKRRKREVCVWVIEGCAWIFGTVTLKYLTSLVFGIADDAHIGNILKSKFIGYKDFDTLMYTCAAEFDFMEKEAIKYILWSLSHTGRYEKDERFNHGELVFHTLQLLAYSVLAILIMRLKLFLTPHLCIMASLVCSKQLFGWLFYKIQPKTLVFAILALMTIEGSANLRTQWNIMGEFSNLPQEELLEWIKVNTRQDAVFAGAMPTMASVKLSTLRPIVNHPHYEDAGLRPGCSMPEIWDVEDPANRGKVPLCTLMSKDSRPYFITVFENSNYRVLKIPKE